MHKFVLGNKENRKNKLQYRAKAHPVTKTLKGNKEINESYRTGNITNGLQCSQLPSKVNTCNPT